MRPIQTNTVVKRLYPVVPPHFFQGRWIQDIDYYEYPQYYTDETTLDNPYGHLPNNIQDWDNEIKREIRKYAKEFLTPYGLTFGALRKQLFQGGYMYGQLLAMEYMWRAVEYVKRTWYDVSVPMSSPGYTWTDAYIQLTFTNNPTIYQTIYTRKIKDKNLFKTLTTYAEPTLTSPEYMSGSKKLDVQIVAFIEGKYKYYVDEELVYVDVSDDYDVIRQVDMYPTN